MNDFFGKQEDARRQSGRLLVLFSAAVACVLLAVYLLAVFLYRWLGDGPAVLWQPDLFFVTTLITLLFITAATIWKMQQLRDGGAAVARSLGGRLVPAQTNDPRERMLRNVVEEMAIASGVPVPDLYLLDHESGINGFAAGHDVHNAAICLTRGALELLDRDELQGVVAHEFSHILNGDMLLNIRLLGWLNGILVVSHTGEFLLRSLRVARGWAALVVLLVAVALLAIGYIGYFFGQLIKSAVSRQRELLGDASAVQFTRNPSGLAGALKKIGGLAKGSLLDHPRAGEMNHMFISSGLTENWLTLFDSHPPLKERILRLEPRFNGVYPPVRPLPEPQHEQQAPIAPSGKPSPMAAPAPLSGAAVLALLDRAGEPMQEHLDLARGLLADLTEPVRAASRIPSGAFAVVCGLLLDPEPALRARQREMIESHGGVAVARELDLIIKDLDCVPQRARLPLLDLSLPALRALSHEQFLRLRQATSALSAADGRLSIFEFTLRYILLRHLAPHFEAKPHQPVSIYGIRGVQSECSCVLTCVSRVGHRSENDAKEAFERGAAILAEPKATFEFLPAAQCGTARMEQAFAKLEVVSPLLKRRLLAACLECVSHDGEVHPSEAEIFRAVADAVGCPTPPWVMPH